MLSAPADVGGADDVPALALCRLPSACDDDVVGSSMQKGYVKKIEGAYRIADTRVSLDSIVYDYLSGLSPESIADNFDTLSLEQSMAQSPIIFRTEKK